MGTMYLVHLLLEVVVVKVPRQRRVGAVFRIGHSRRWIAVLECGVDPVAQELVEALCGRCELLQIGVVEGSKRRGVEYFPIRVREDQVHGIGRPAVRESLASEDDAVSVEERVEPPGLPVDRPVVELCLDEGRGILLQRLLDGRLVRSVVGEVHLATDLGQASQANLFWERLRIQLAPERAPLLVEALVDDQRVELVGELPGLTELAVDDVPAKVHLALAVSLGDLNVDRTALHEVVDGQS